MSGSINFHYYDQTNRVPGVYAEVDPSKANTGQQNLRSLVIGQCNLSNASNPITPDQYGIPEISTGVQDAKGKYGIGSMLALMVEAYRKADNFGELWELPLADADGSTSATANIGVTGTALQNGTVQFYIAGVNVPIPVTAGDTGAVVLGNLYSALSSDIYPDLPITAAAPVNGNLALTAVAPGQWGNEIDVRVNYYGPTNGEVTPPGLTITTQMLAGGATNPSLVGALSNLSDQTFDFIVCPYTDVTSLNAVRDFLNDQSGRWSWQVMLYGGAFAAYRGSLGTLAAFGTGRNDQHMSIMGFNNSPTPAWIWAADYAANVAVSVRADPAQPLQTVGLPSCLPPPVPDRFTISERNTLLYDGISTFRVDAGGMVRIERGITTYQKNPNGALDDSYLDVETMFTLQYLIRDMADYLATQFQRKKLVADGSIIPAGSNMVTAQLVKVSAIARYRQQCDAGYAQTPELFASTIVAQNAGNGLVKLMVPFNLANQLRQIAMLVQFQKT